MTLLCKHSAIPTIIITSVPETAAEAPSKSREEHSGEDPCPEEVPTRRKVAVRAYTSISAIDSAAGWTRPFVLDIICACSITSGLRPAHTVALHVY